MKRIRAWRYVFPVLALILWIITICLFFKINQSYHTDDFEALAQLANAQRWQPACCVGAIISTAAAYVLEELKQYIDDEIQESMDA